MIRGLVGADPSTGAIEIGQVIEVGATVQFQVRDPVSADKDLRLAVERALAELPGRPVGALLFTCNGRGRRMFGSPITTPQPFPSCWAAFRWPVSSPPGRSARSRPQRAARVYRVDGAVPGMRCRPIAIRLICPTGPRRAALALKRARRALPR
ncbi:FIST C domain protein [Mycobacterium xenopi 4042]|uniref:FIST C domain protein n=1 Tax=Mycobacterium xenopi 4042 TaxID=1299334 RepID=X8C9U5_MYCXE|nr:FIST C domain protein [Mycobacterium xenopi 4042]